MTEIRTKAVYIATTLLLLTGCQSMFGPSALRNTHPAYNQAILNTLDEQMLLNLVRLRYSDGSYFLEVGSVTASLSLGAFAGIDTELATDTIPSLIKPNAGMTYSDNPTISYAPLQGEDFLKKILSPLSLDSVLVMTESGWSVERVAGITIERMNGVFNAPSASGPTPTGEPRFKRFKRVVTILRKLQHANLIELGPDLKTKNPFLSIKPSQELARQIEELRTLLNLTDKTNTYQITSNFLDQSPKQIDLRTRSIGSVLWYLSQNMRIPIEDEKAGLVTVTRRADGQVFDWGETPAGGFFEIKSSADRPENAFVAVPYRDVWFYIADNDLKSKRTFMLLKQLFNLQAGQIKAVTPTLTIPVGGSG